MALIKADRVKETSTSTGTGNFTLAGAATGYVAFSSVCSVSDTFYYVISNQSNGEWESGLGTYSSANTLTRTTVHYSSNSNNAVDFSAGTKEVFISLTKTQLDGFATTPVSLTTSVSGILPVANGGTGTNTGSITGTGALTFAAGGTNQNVTINPSGTGYANVAGVQIKNKGTQNVGIIYPLSNASTGAFNIGISGLTGVTTGSYSVGIGSSAISGVFTSNYSTAVGHEAGYKNQFGSGNLLNDPEGCTYIGALSRGKDNYESNAIVIGYDARGKGTNTTVIGNSSTTQTWLGGGELRLPGSTSGYVGLKGAAVAGSVTYTLPSADGTSGQMLSTNGSGTLSWSTVASSGGTVTSVGGTGTVNGITLTGTVTSSGNLTLGGSLSGVSLSTQVSGILPIANGGTGASDDATARSNLGLGSMATQNNTNVLIIGGSISNTTINGNISGNATNVTGTVAIANGGTGQTTASAAFNALSPLTTLGDVLYASGANTNARLAGNTTTTKNFLSQTGTGSASAAPAWSTVSKSDVGLSNVENTALSTWAGTSNITTLGTVANGTWNATAIGVSKGGTGATTAQAGINALAGATTSGQYLRGNGTNVVMSAIQAGDVPTLNQNTTGTASNVTGTVAIANGGTGQTTAANAINALLPTQTSNSGKFLTTNGTAASWATVSASPAGSSGQIQYNSSGSFAGAAKIKISTTGWLSLEDGYANTVVGQEAMQTTSVVANNTACGFRALQYATTNGHVAFGSLAGTNVSTGYVNSFFGYNAGNIVTSGGGNVCLGFDAQASSATVNDEFTLGYSGITTLRCAVTSITSISDQRDKTNIQPMPSVLSFIASLNPVRFDWWTRDGIKIGVPDYGFIAQELQQAQASTGFDWAQLVYESNPEKLEASPGKLIPILVKAIQELSAKVAALEASA